jgi:hypothetical protein
MAGPAYSRPPLIVDTSVASVAGTATATVVAAPGVGFAIRVVGFILGINRSTTGIADLVLRAATTTSFRIGLANGLSVGGMSNVTKQIAEPGVQLPANEALQLVDTNTAATGSAAAMVEYYIDPV